jgi:hypothetical protein
MWRMACSHFLGPVHQIVIGVFLSIIILCLILTCRLVMLIRAFHLS